MKFEVEVTQTVEVELDETKFTDEFMEEYRECFYNHVTIEDHAKHLAQLEARGMTTGMPDEFIEGYGPVKDFGIVMEVTDQEEMIRPPRV